MTVLAACLVFAGCLSLSLCQGRNWKAVAGSAPIAFTQAVIRYAGWILLGAALAVAVAVEGPGFAVLAWTLQIAVASFVVAVTLSYRPGLFRPIASAYSTFAAKISSLGRRS